MGSFLGDQDSLVRTRCKRLDDGHLVAILFRPLFPGRQVVDEEEGSGPHDDKVEAHRNKDPEDRADVIEDPVGLLSENEDDPGTDDSKLDQHRLSSRSNAGQRRQLTYRGDRAEPEGRNRAEIWSRTSPCPLTICPGT